MEDNMKNNKNWLGILTMVLILGFTVIGCDDDGGGSVDSSVWNKLKNTEWEKANASIKFGADSSDNMAVDVSVEGSRRTGPIISLSSTKLTIRDNHFSFDFAISGDGNKLTVSNFSGAAADYNANAHGEYTKK